ncbi:hypothetical protein [uncultured Roseobacter sp.]|uniref:hypothetical protein n=1 Tax=uncultured Roseobacter sp. TaxID=114847 RepID=UPI002627B44F|nr:hypothetical protein [uncultured Roseobacter sp.]
MTFEEKTGIMNDLELLDESPNTAGDDDDVDLPDIIIWYPDGGSVKEAPADDDDDLPDIIIWDIDGGNVTEARADDGTPNSIDPDHPEPAPAVVYDMAPLKTVVLSSNALDLTTAPADDDAAPSDDDDVDIPDDIAWDLAGGNVAATHHGRDDDLLDMIMEDMTGTSEKPDDILTRDPDDIVDDPTDSHGDTGNEGGLPDIIVHDDNDDSDELPDLIVATLSAAQTDEGAMTGQDAFEFALPEPDPGEIGMSLWFDMA